MAARDGIMLEHGAKPKGGDISDDDLADMGIAGF